MSTWVHRAAHEGLSFGFVLPQTMLPLHCPTLCPLPHRHFLPWDVHPLPALPSQAAKPDLNQRSSFFPPLFSHPYPSLAATAPGVAAVTLLMSQVEPERSSSSCEWGFSLHSSSWQEPRSRRPHLWRRKPGSNPGMFGQCLQQ